jgi:hypothetical protein
MPLKRIPVAGVKRKGPKAQGNTKKKAKKEQAQQQEATPAYDASITMRESPPYQQSPQSIMNMIQSDEDMVSDTDAESLRVQIRALKHRPLARKVYRKHVLQEWDTYMDSYADDATIPLPIKMFALTLTIETKDPRHFSQLIDSLCQDVSKVLCESYLDVAWELSLLFRLCKVLGADFIANPKPPIHTHSKEWFMSTYTNWSPVSFALLLAGRRLGESMWQVPMFNHWNVHYSSGTCLKAAAMHVRSSQFPIRDLAKRAGKMMGEAGIFYVYPGKGLCFQNPTEIGLLLQPFEETDDSPYVWPTNFAFESDTQRVNDRRKKYRAETKSSIAKHCVQSIIPLVELVYHYVFAPLIVVDALNKK